MNEIYTKLAAALKLKKPFAVYKKPAATNCTAIFQKNTKTYTVTTFKESGFVFAPFDTVKKTILIPLSFSECITKKIVLKKTPLTTVSNVAVLQDKSTHIALVAKSIAKINQNKFEKVVLSRKQTVKKEAKAVLKQL